eukprot:293196_1
MNAVGQVDPSLPLELQVSITDSISSGQVSTNSDPASREIQPLVTPDSDLDPNSDIDDSSSEDAGNDSRWVRTARIMVKSTNTKLSGFLSNRQSVNTNQEEFFQPSKSELESHTRRVEPVIYLETLSARAMYFMVTVSYLTVLLALVLGIFEREIRFNIVEYSSQPTKTINSSDGSVLPAEGIYSSVWAEDIPFLLHDRYISLSVAIRRYGLDLPTFSKDVKFFVTTQAHSVADPSESSELMAATLSAQLSCAFGATHCEPARLLWPWRSPMGRNWQDRMLDP